MFAAPHLLPSAAAPFVLSLSPSRIDIAREREGGKHTKRDRTLTPLRISLKPRSSEAAACESTERRTVKPMRGDATERRRAAGGAAAREVDARIEVVLMEAVDAMRG